MKKLICIPLLIVSFVSFGQGEFKFEEEKHDFGTIKEGDQAKHIFKFTNVGNEPIIISKVKASCGCTTPSWTNTPVPPGGKGEVTASYNSKNRPGAFHKTITITSNAKLPTKVLRINGFTEKDLQAHYTQEEIDNSPVMYVRDNEFNFGKVNKGQQVARQFELENKGKSDLKVYSVRSNCNCVTLEKMFEGDIKPGDTGVIKLKYRPNMSGDQLEYVNVVTNDIVTQTPMKIVLRSKVEEAENNSLIRSDDKITF